MGFLLICLTFDEPDNRLSKTYRWGTFIGPFYEKAWKKFVLLMPVICGVIKK